MGKLNAARVIEALQRNDGLITHAAKQLRCHRSTIHNYINSHPSVATALQDVRERLGDLAEKRLHQAIERGEPWAIAFYLKCLHKSRGYIERPEPPRAQALPADFIEAFVEARKMAIARRQAAQQALTNGQVIDVTPTTPPQP